ncbi:MAG: PEGA domain-containing protein [Patescibacteria group bacterium]|nr:PEGA domain-containing protein [Patescibacteria group bacterium]
MIIKKSNKRKKLQNNKQPNACESNKNTDQFLLNKIRFVISLITLVFVISTATVAFLYAKGFRISHESGKIIPSGLLVLKSVPDGAQIIIDGELKTATNATISLESKAYDVIVRKEGYFDWNKRLTIKEQEVTEATAYLFKTAPSLSAITFTGISKVFPSRDLTKIAYIIPPSSSPSQNKQTAGIWVMEMLNLPLGLSREPKRITDGNLENAIIEWSPDQSQVLVKLSSSAFLLDTNTFTPQEKRINIQPTINELYANWEKVKKDKNNSQLVKLPEEVKSILSKKSRDFIFSPDEKMVMYIASGSATIPNDLLKKLPGSSTQTETRELSDSKVYVYDLVEDKNFLIDDGSAETDLGTLPNAKRRLSWFPTSRHIVIADINNISIIDYDGTNKQSVYSGAYTAPHAYPSVSTDRLIILTNLGASGSLPNLYSLSLR